MIRATTTVRLPADILRELKARALKEGKSFNRLVLEMARVFLKGQQEEKGGIPPGDPLWEIGRNPGRSGCKDGSVQLDDYLYGPVRYKPGK